MKAVILAAGKGTRFLPVTNITPKPLLKIKNKEILSFILDSLPNEIDEIYIILKHLDNKIKIFIKDNYKHTKITCVRQGRISGTLGALLSIKDVLIKENKFLVMNGDDIFSKKDIEKIIKEDFAMGIKKDKLEKGYLMIEKNKSGYVKGFKSPTEKELKNDQNIGTGIYLLNKNFWKYLPKEIVSGKEYGIPSTLRAVLLKNKIKAVTTNSYLKNNSPKDLLKNVKYIDPYF